MLGDEGEQQEEDCDHGGDDASRDLRSVETGSYSKRRNSTHIANCTHRRDLSHNVARRVMDPKIHECGPSRQRGRLEKTLHQHIKIYMMGVGELFPIIEVGRRNIDQITCNW